MTDDTIERKLEVLSTIGKALAHPARVELLHLLEDGERCGCDLVPLLNLDPSVVSRHLAMLARAGLIVSKRAGVRIMWWLATPDVARILSCLVRMRCQKESG